MDKEQLAKQEPFWLQAFIRFDAPAPAGTALTFFTEKNDKDLIIVGATSDLFDPYALDTATRAVPSLLIDLRATGTDIQFTRTPLPVWTFADNVYQPVSSRWQTPYILPAQTSIQLDCKIDRSPTVDPQNPQGIQGYIIFHAVRAKAIR